MTRTGPALDRAAGVPSLSCDRVTFALCVYTSIAQKISYRKFGSLMRCMASTFPYERSSTLSETDASLAKLGRRSELETARAQPVQEHAPSKLTGTRVSADCGSLQRKAGPARHSDGDAFFHFAGVAHLFGSCAAKESITSESDVNPSQTSIGAAKAGRQTPPSPGLLAVSDARYRAP